MSQLDDPFHREEDVAREQIRTCRYGHGELFSFTETGGRKVFAAVAWGFHDDRASPPKWMAPLQWSFCPTCGYGEFTDPSPSETIRQIGSD